MPPAAGVAATRGAAGTPRAEAGAAFGAGGTAAIGRAGPATPAGPLGAGGGSGGPIGPKPIIVGDRGRTGPGPFGMGAGGGGTVIGEGMLLGSSNEGPSWASVRPPPSSSSHGLSSASEGDAGSRVRVLVVVVHGRARLAVTPTRSSRRCAARVAFLACARIAARRPPGEQLSHFRDYRKPSRRRSLRALCRETSTRLPVDRHAT